MMVVAKDVLELAKRCARGLRGVARDCGTVERERRIVARRAHVSIERCWSALERHWNGSLLNSVSTAINWARTMTWKMLHPTAVLSAA